MSLRKYGTSDEQQVIEVEAPQDGDGIKVAAALADWTVEDERDLQAESKD